MKLLTKEILERFKKNGYQGDTKLEKQEIVVKFFNPCGAGTWYATEYDPDEKMFFGWVSIFGDHNDEAGEFSLAELEGLKLGFGLGIERDLHFGKGRLLGEVMKN